MSCPRHAQNGIESATIRVPDVSELQAAGRYRNPGRRAPGATGFGAFVFVTMPHPASRMSNAARITSKVLVFRGEVISFPITRKMESSCRFGRIIANEIRKSHEIVCARAPAGTREGRTPRK